MATTDNVLWTAPNMNYSMIAPGTGWYSMTPGSLTPYVAGVIPERKSVRGLFEVFIVNPEVGSVHRKALVVANDAEAAKLKAIRQNYANDVDIDAFDIIVRWVGDVRPKAKTKD